MFNLIRKKNKTVPSVQNKIMALNGEEDHKDEENDFSEHVIIDESHGDFMMNALSRYEHRYNNQTPSSKELDLKKYDIIQTLGTGTFGTVLLVRRIHGDGIRAMKVMKKKEIIKSKQLSHTLDEKRILYSIYHPFVVRLYGSYKDNSNVYMSMEFVPGGELYSLIRKNIHLSENHAKFYAAQITLVFEYLHSLRLIFRDLKPENILIGSDGYIKLTDFGFAKVCHGHAYTLCGTPEYLAPEVILSRGYNKGVDYWALGVLIYEMVKGSSPFVHKDPMKIYEKICSGRYPRIKGASDEVRSIIKHLLQVDLTRRYGILKNGVQDIKNHRWFYSIHWDQLFQKTLKAPYLPNLRSPTDTSNFEKFTHEKIMRNSQIEFQDEFKDF